MSLTAVKQPGIALVYEQLLGFDGDEFYTASWPVSVAELSHRIHTFLLGMRSQKRTSFYSPTSFFN
jgi:hypothetical protein